MFTWDILNQGAFTNLITIVVDDITIITDFLTNQDWKMPISDLAQDFAILIADSAVSIHLVIYH